MRPILLAAYLLLLAFAGRSQVFNGTGGNIPDGLGQVCFPITVSGVGTINGTYGLASVCVNITHTYDSDLDIVLQTPDGQSIPLSIGNGGNGNNYITTCFTSTAATPITAGTPPFNGTYLPEGQLGFANNGQNADGVWRICIRDWVTGDAGVLNSWTLNFNNTPAAPPVPPPNDNPCNAIVLTPTTACNYQTYTTLNASGTTGVPTPSCSSYNGGDVWFQTTVPSGGALNIDTEDMQVYDGAMAVYTGTCGSLTQIACNDDGSNNGLMPMLQLNNLTPGTVVWIRFFSYDNDETGTFGICVTTPPPPNVQDCPAALSICQNVYHTNASYVGTGNINNEINTANSCLSSGEKNDVWYTFTVTTSGNLNFTITPNVLTEDYDWQVFNITGHTCADLYSNASLSVSCNFSADDGPTGPNGGSAQTNQGAAGTPYNAVIPVTAGQTYMINVSNFSSSNNGYTIDFSASTASIFDNVTPYLANVNASTLCGGTQVAANFSENVLCSTVQTTDFSLTGPGGPYTINNWQSATCSSGAPYGISIVLDVTPTISTNGNYQLCLTNASGSVTDLCGNVASPACMNFTVNTTVPTFTIPSSVCYNTTAPVLPTTSNNGITGTWSPSTVSNTVAGAYTFTPSTGQCAVPVTINIAITHGANPIFNGIPAICYGATPPNLPATSVNGIAGTWSPSTISNTATGIYTFTPNAATCSPPANILVSVVQPVTSSTTVNLCSSQLPYTWNGNTYNAAGTYSVHLTPVSGCDSIATLQLNVSNSITSTVNLAVCQSQLPYTWNGNNYNAAGTYNVTLTSVSGCDSVVTLNLSIKPNSTSTTNIAICPSQLPYTWNGNNYNTAGTYNVTLISASGCDSVATLNLTIKPNSTSSTNLAVCPTQLPYTWNGNNYNAAGSYHVTLLSASGCDSVATLNLTIKPNSTSTTNLAICPAQLPYTWNGNNYNTAGTYNVTLISASGCDSVATLNLTVNANSTSTTNLAVCPAQLPYTWNGNNYNAAGTYNVTLISASGCDSVATLNLTIKPNSTSTTNLAVCPAQLPYTWNGNNYNAAGTYNVTLLSSSGCDSVATLNLTIKPNSTSTTNLAVCPAHLPYTWNGNNYNAAGTYNVTLISASGCDSVATLNLAIKPNSTSTTNLAVCPAQLPYTWNGNNYNAAGTYNVTLISASGCDSVATLNLTIKPNSTSTTNLAVCPAQLPYSWNGNNYNAAGTYNVTLISASGCDSVATLNLTVNANSTSTTNLAVCPAQLPYTWNGNNYNAAGTYNVTLLSSSGCDSVATLNLNIKPNSTSTTNLAVCPAQLPYTWNGNNYNAAGTYNVTLLSSSGCDSVATLNLAIKPNSTSTTNLAVCPAQLPYTWNGNNYNAAGSYNVTLISASGCDSVATLNLAIKPNSTSTTNLAVCPAQLPYTWNGNNYNAAGSYNVTLISASGCDSVATLNLTIKPNSTSTTNLAVCPAQLPYTWNGNNYNAAGIYNVTLLSASGCDSVATLNLAIKPNSTSTTNLAVCPAQLPYTWNGNNYNAAGSYNVTLLSASGCDSVATLNLTIKPNSTSTTNLAVCPAQLPYTWNGNNYNAAGTYNVTLTSASGCDSVATLNLTVNANSTSTTNLAVCPAQLPYTWNGNNYNAAGTYNVTLTSASGCDSVATLNLTVNPVLSSSTSITICNSALPYNWNSNTYNSAGTYTVTLTGSTGCDSLATLILAINNFSTSVTNVNVCTASLPYNWNGNNYNSAGSFSVNLVGASGCDSIATLNLVVNTPTNSTTNQTVCSNQLPFVWNTNSYNSAGTYSIVLTNSTGCDSTATLVLSVNATSSSVTNHSVCAEQLPYNWNGQSYNAAGTYNVTLTGSTGCDSIATLNLTVNSFSTSTTNVTICNAALPYSWNSQTYNTAGTYNVTLTGSTGCDSIASLNLTVNNFSTSTTNVTICNAALPYSWNGQTYSTAGTYNVTLTGSTGCDSIATLNLTVNSFSTSLTNVTICNAALPYSWNGQTYIAAGTYNVTLTGATGCDSIATLNLTVNSFSTSTTNVTICNAALPYSWNGNSYNAAGTYNITLTGSTGCDSIATLNLTVNNFSTSTTNVTVCNAALPYSWNGQTYNAAGTYNVTLTGATGCDSIATLNLTVNSFSTSTTNVTVCNAALPYSWNGQSYNAAGTYNVTLTCSTGCDSIATLNLTVNSFSTSTTNVTVCNAALPYSWNGQSYNAAGTYNVTLTGSTGCDSIATLNLTVNNFSTSTTNVTICNAGLPYSWNGQTYNAAGTYNVTLTGATGCDSIATLNLAVNNFSTSTTNVTVCNAALPYSWNGQSYNAAGTYNVTLTGSTGCDSIATLNLTVNNFSTSTTNVTICNAALPYSWNGQSYIAAGTYNVTLTGSTGCDSIATLNLTVNNFSTSTTNVTVCNAALPYSWNGQTYNAAGSYNVTLTGATGCDSIATLNLTLNSFSTSTTNVTICNAALPYLWNGQTYNAAGSYNVTLTGSTGCDSIATLNLTVNNFSTSTTNVTVCNAALPYSWNGQSYNAAGTYNVTLTGSTGCDSIATLNLTVNSFSTSTTNVTVCNAALPYSWNGQTYNTAGTYTVTLTGSTGCDSIATLNLTVNNFSTSTTNVTVCNAALPYSWNGQTYNAAGSYNVTLTGSTGCDSIATLNLAVNNFSTSTTNVTVCNAALPYSWNGQSYNAAGTYNVTLTGSTGCDSIATLILTINNFSTSTTNVTVCNAALPYSWNGQSYNAAGTYNVTLTGSTGCDSIATLNLTVNQASSSQTQISVCASQLPYSWNGLQLNAAGSYSVTLANQSGCDSIANLNFSLLASSTSNSSVAICHAATPYSWNGLSINAAGNYQVTLTNSLGCDSLANLSLSFLPDISDTLYVSTCSDQLPYQWNGQQLNTNGEYIVHLNASNGCDSAVHLFFTVKQVTQSNNTITVCRPDLPIQWQGQTLNAAGMYHATLVNSVGCDSLLTVQLIVRDTTNSLTNRTICSADLPFAWNGQIFNASGVYLVILTNAQGCDSMARLQLQVNPTPNTPVVNSPLIFCQYDAPGSILSQVSPQQNLLWYNTATGGTPTTSIPQLSTITAGTTHIYVSTENRGCESGRADIQITVNQKPALGPDKSANLCEGDSLNLLNQYNLSGLNYTWGYLFQPLQSLYVKSPGIYTLTVSNANGCTDTTMFRLYIMPLPVADAGPDTTVEFMQPYTLHGNGGGDYLWSPAQLLNNAHAQNPVTTLDQDMTFILKVTDKYGCSDTDQVHLRVLKGPGFYIPSAFTPNGDGLNDIFRPTAVGIARLDYFQIFNRYGELVFSTNNPKEGWDGTYKGQKQSIGNYVWVIHGLDRLGVTREMRGNVVLIR